MADDFYKHYPADFLDGVVGMTLEEVGAYIILLDHMYMTGRPLRDDDHYIAGILRCDVRVWRRLKDLPAFRSKWTLNEEGMRVQSRWNAERLQRECAHNARALAGHKGGISSGQSRKNKDLAEAEPKSASSKTNQIRGDKKREEESKGSAQVASLPTPRVELEKVLDAEHAKAVIDHRQKLRKPLTARAAELLAKKLAQAPSPNDAADLMIEKGWHSYEPTWGAAAKKQQNGGWVEPAGVRYARGANGEVLVDQFGAPVEEA